MSSTGLKRSFTVYRDFSGLTHHRAPFPSTSALDVENQVILGHNVRRDGDELSETMFLNAADDGGEYELVYFKRLDDEFNKVLKFYKVKVEEVMKEVAVLNRQMEALVAFRVKVENLSGWSDRLDEETNQRVSDVAASRAALYAIVAAILGFLIWGRNQTHDLGFV